MRRYTSLIIARGKIFHDLCIRDIGTEMFEYDGLEISYGSGFQRLKNKGLEVDLMAATTIFSYAC